MTSSSFGGTSGFRRTGATGVRFRIASATSQCFRRGTAETGDHFVEHDSKGKQVGAGIQLFAAHLFGRHVGAVPIAVPGCVSRSGWPAVVMVEGFVARRDGINFARPKSKILTWPRSVTKMFAGLMSGE